MKIAIAAQTEIPARRANTFQVMKMAQALADTGNIVRLTAPIAIQGQVVSWEILARHYGLRSVFPVDWLKAEPRLRRYDYGWRAVRWARSWGADLFYTRLPQAAALASFWGMPTILFYWPSGPEPLWDILGVNHLLSAGFYHQTVRANHGLGCYCRLPAPGSGRGIFGTLRGWFAARGLQRIEVRAAVRNEVSRRFWRKVGFKACMEVLYREI